MASPRAVGVTKTGGATRTGSARRATPDIPPYQPQVTPQSPRGHRPPMRFYADALKTCDFCIQKMTLRRSTPKGHAVHKSHLAIKWTRGSSPRTNRPKQRPARATPTEWRATPIYQFSPGSNFARSSTVPPSRQHLMIEVPSGIRSFSRNPLSCSRKNSKRAEAPLS